MEESNGYGLFGQVNERLFKARTIILSGEVNSQMAANAIGQLQALAAESDDPIMLFLNAQGQDVESGDALYDVIRFVEPRVRIVGTGSVAGSAALVYVAVGREDRYSLPNARFQLHQPLGRFGGGRARDVEAEADEVRRLRDRINRLFADATGQPLERIAEDTDRPLWMDAAEAHAYGLVGRIVGSIRDIPHGR